MRKTAKMLAAIGVAAVVAVPAAAEAGPGHAHGKKANYVFKGDYAGAGVVNVTGGNAKVRKGGLVGTAVSFDLTTAKVTVADTTGDSLQDANDVLVGDKVLVKARVAKDGSDVQPYVARRLVDQTNPPEEDAEGEDGGEEVPTE